MNAFLNPRPDWLRRYQDDYLTLEEIGVYEKITGEAVRQRLIRIGITPRTLKETSSLREQREIKRNQESIRRVFLQTRSVEETAKQLGIQVSWVQRFVKEDIPDSDVLVKVPRSVAKRYPNQALLESLREAASQSQANLTAISYDEFVRAEPFLADGRPRPGKQTMLLRFDSWRAALESAGLPANPHSGPEKEFDAIEAINGVVECWRTTGHPPTAAQYDLWQRGREGLPSGATARKRVGGWNLLLVKAWQVIHGVILDQDDIDVSVPTSLFSGDNEQTLNVYVGYRAANEGTQVSLPSEMAIEKYQALERAVQSHAIIQNTVANAAISHGFTPWSPSAEGPKFDIALSNGKKKIFIVEVKSATYENLEFQLRIGVGQVLRYAQQLRSDDYTIVPVIAIECRPDSNWKDLLQELGIGLLVFESISNDLSHLVTEDLFDEQNGINSQARVV